MALFQVDKIVKKAQHSSFYLKLLNFGLSRKIPFNKPHGYRILEISDYSIKTILPFKRANLNHIRSLHACSMATISEFTTGFLLISNLDPKQYRLIMKEIDMKFFYQGKTDAILNFEISKEWLESKIFLPLKNEGVVEVVCEVKVYDVRDNHLATGNVIWQIKDWKKVKTKV